MIDWPEDTGSAASPAQRAILLRRLRRTLAELEEMGIVAPAGLVALAASAPDTDGEADDPVNNLPI